MIRFKNLKLLGAIGATALLAGALAGASENGSGLAVYRVPVPARLLPYSQFRVADFAYVTRAGKILITYTLPAELTGMPYQRVQFEGTDLGQSRLALNGEQGSADCQRLPKQITCSVKMKNLQTDHNGLATILRNQSVTQSELTSRLEVASRFSGDPIGFVTYFY